MDIIAVQSAVTDAGFPMKTQEIKDIVSRFLKAVEIRQVRSSLAGDTYSVRQVLHFLFEKDIGTAYVVYWKKSVKLYPRLAEFELLAVYGATSKPVSSLTIVGVVHLFAVLRTFADYEGKDKKAVQKPLTFEEPQLVTDIEGFIYILSDSHRKVLKIGFSSDINTRIKSHQSSNPFLTPVALYAVRSRESEPLLHSALQRHRLPKTREWYADSLEIRQSIFNFFHNAG